MMTRRPVLQWLAATPALAGCNGVALPDAYAAWRDPGAGEADPRRFALAHAILAPNPHNSQAWQVELDDDRDDPGMTLYCDLDRRLHATDPFDRQITIGCGAFLQLYVLAAQHLGYAPALHMFPEGEPDGVLDARPLARIGLGPRARESEASQADVEALFAQIPARRTNKQNYDPALPPSAAEFEALDAVTRPGGDLFHGALHWTADASRVAALRGLIWQAWQLEMRTRGPVLETYQWLRVGREAISRHADGIGIDGPMIPALKALGFFGQDDFLNPDSLANTSAAKDWRAKLDSAPAFLWLTTRDNTPSTRLRAGMTYARLNLAANRLGLAIHPWSQALQEYEEMAPLYTQVREALGAGDETVQMLVRIGHATPSDPTPRRALSAVIRPAAP